MNTSSGRIGVLTSGGDCAGLNAALRAITLRANSLGFSVFGIRNGAQGLLESPADTVSLEIAAMDVALLRKGGTILGTLNQRDPYAWPMPDGSRKDRSGEIIDTLRKTNCKGLIGIGGDGSMAVFARLTRPSGIPFIGVPKTIDNDIAQTERAIGFSTALEIVTESIDRLHSTAESHRRIMVVEVMGRDAGHIALSAGIAGGADVILIPEIPIDFTQLVAHIKALYARGRNSAVVVVSEAVRTPEGEQLVHAFGETQKRLGGIGQRLGDFLAQETGIETRSTALGYVQRGGDPGAHDRILASALGTHAAELIAQGQTDRMVAWRDGQVIDVPLDTVVNVNQFVDPKGVLVRTARGLGIYVGGEF